MVPKVFLYEPGAIPDFSQRDSLELLPHGTVLSYRKGGAWMQLEIGGSAEERTFGWVAPASSGQERLALCLADNCAGPKVCLGVEWG